MTRMSYLSAIVMAALTLGLSSAHANDTAKPAKNACRCLPDESCWPDAKSWNSLKNQLTGRLIKPVYELDACLKDSASKTCTTTLKNLHNPFHIENNPGDTQSQGLLNAWQNHASAYAIEAENSEDVAAAIKFAHQHHLRVAIKGTGHDYLGRSNAANSLLIWTHKMREMTFDKNFIPAGCEDVKRGDQALTVGAGTRWLEAYDEATNKNNRYVQGGGCTTVGVAGGFTQGGGFGSFSKKYGTGAASILEVEIVTADGKILTANRCQNQDLFWAIRGGGGGTFGVVTKMTLKTHALPKLFGIYEATIKAANDTAYKALIKEFITFYHSSLNNDHWGEQASFKPDNTLSLTLLFQGLSETQARYTFSPLSKFLNTHKDDYSIETNIIVIPANKFWNLENIKKDMPAFVVENKQSGAAKNQFWWAPNSQEVSKFWYAYQSWWLPIQLFDDEHKDKLTNALFQASRLTNTSLHFNKGLSGSPNAVQSEVKNTATNPSVLDAAALVIMTAGDNNVYPGVKGKQPDLDKAKKSADNITRALNYIKPLAPEAGTYVNESDYSLPNWQTAYWGENYSKLQAIKNKYDPDGVFYCHHCVGSEKWSSDGICEIRK